MGVTAIKRVVNEIEASVRVSVTNLENPGRHLNSVRLGGAGSSAECDIWIPWCTSHLEFEHNKYIKVEVFGPPNGANPAPVIATHLIWQHDPPNQGGSFGFVPTEEDGVRTTTGTQFVTPGDLIGGEWRVNGDRILRIREEGPFLEAIRR